MIKGKNDSKRKAKSFKENLIEHIPAIIKGIELGFEELRRKIHRMEDVILDLKHKVDIKQVEPKKNDLDLKSFNRVVILNTLDACTQALKNQQTILDLYLGNNVSEPSFDCKFLIIAINDCREILLK